jgi:prevent-host-death family protein
MSDVVVTASELARNASSLLDEVARGRTVVVHRRGRPVARLVPIPTDGSSVLGSMAGRARALADDDVLLQPIPDWASE